MGGKMGCLCGSVGEVRRDKVKAVKVRQAVQRPGVAGPVDDENEFTVDVLAGGGVLWRLGGLLRSHTAGMLKERLMADEVRFRTHRADLVLGAKVLGDSESLGRAGVGPGTLLTAIFTDLSATVLVLGGGAAGRRAVEALSPAFRDQWIVLVDAQEYSEHPGGLLRAYTDPAAWESIVVSHEEVARHYPNVRFVHGECTRLHSSSASFVAFGGAEFVVRFDFCVVATGCSWAPLRPSGESLWCPSSLRAARKDSEWKEFDERIMSGRRRHIVAEHRQLWALHDKSGSALVVGADPQGVEWACDLRHYFPQLKVTLIDRLPRCLANLPPAAAEYAQRYLNDAGVRCFYEMDFEPDNPNFWKNVDLPWGADAVYSLTGVRARNGFMPSATLSSQGPGGGGWIVTNSALQVCCRGQRRDGGKAGDRPGELWASGHIFAVGNCHFGTVLAPKQLERAAYAAGANVTDAKFLIPPVPKNAFGATTWAAVAASNIAAMKEELPLEEATWPVDAGIAAVGLGPKDGVACWKATFQLDSGEVILQGGAAAEMKRRLSWPAQRAWLIEPSRWVATFKAGLPAGRRLLG